MASGGDSCGSCLPPRGAFALRSERVAKCCEVKVSVLGQGNWEEGEG